MQGCDIHYDDDEYEYEYEDDFDYEYDDEYYGDDGTMKHRKSQADDADDDAYDDYDDDEHSMQFCTDNMPTEASSAASSSDTLSSGATAGIAIAGAVVGGGVLVGAGFAVHKVIAAKSAASMANTALKGGAVGNKL